ncbi:MAG: kelch repeat-containing protein, partial [Polyangia bacterium]|nr:kelch repeat-containing protein [Polyangia bacterium]
FVMRIIPGVVELLWRLGEDRWRETPVLFFGRDPETAELRLGRLGRSSLMAQTGWRLVEVAGALLQAAQVQGTVARSRSWPLSGDHSTDLLFLYSEASLSADGATVPARLLVAELGDETDALLEDGSLVFSGAVPQVQGATLVHAGLRDELLLVGHPIGGGSISLWRLALDAGAWEGPTPLLGLGDLRGCAVVLDPLHDQLLLFSGERQASATHAPEPSDGLYALDLQSLNSRVISTVGASPALRRTQPGAMYEPYEQALYVGGGKRGDALLGDLWRLDLLGGTWSQIATGAQGEPSGLGVAPTILRDRQRDRLLVATPAGPSGVDARLWVRDATLAWASTSPWLPAQPATWPVTGVALVGQTPSFPWRTTASASWPGELLLASLSTEPEGALGLRVLGAGGEVLAEGAAGGFTGERAAWRCPPGEACTVQVVRRAGSSAAEYALSVQVAEAVLDTESAAGPPVRALELPVGQVATVGHFGLELLDPQSLEAMGSIHPPALLATRGLARCGDFLCVAHLHPRGLAVVDARTPTAPQLVGSAFTYGLGWDLATLGSRVFVAEGARGVGEYFVGPAGDPSFVRRFEPGGLVTSLALRWPILAVASQTRVTLYDLSEEPRQAGVVPALGPISAAAYVGRHLWLLGAGGTKVEVWSVADPAAPVLLGEITEDAAQAFALRFRGDQAYTVNGPRMERWAIRPTGQ